MMTIESSPEEFLRKRELADEEHERQYELYELRKEQRKAYYKTINQEKVKCFCGRLVRKVSLQAHHKTSLH